MKPAVPREIVNARGRFEEDDGRALYRWRVARDKLSHADYFEIVNSADKSALDVLFEEFSHERHTTELSRHQFFFRAFVSLW